MRVPFAVSIDEEILQAAKDAAKRRGWSVSLLIRTALKDYLGRNSKKEK